MHNHQLFLILKQDHIHKISLVLKIPHHTKKSPFLTLQAKKDLPFRYFLCNTLNLNLSPFEATIQPNLAKRNLFKPNHYILFLSSKKSFKTSKQDNYVILSCNPTRISSQWNPYCHTPYLGS